MQAQAIDEIDGRTALKMPAGLRLTSVPRGGLPPRQRRRAEDLLLASPGDDASLDEIAAAIGLSRSHFIRAFRESCGETPHRWRVARRVEQAMELLARRDMALTEIALVCGFADQAHLTRVFRRHAGTPPGAWRRSLDWADA